MADNIKYFSETDLLYLVALIKSEFDKYVKIVQGKQLSTEDFTTALKNTLEGIKRTNKNYGLSQEDFTTALLNKLNSIDIEELSNVQADFNQTDTTKDDYIKNKPNMTLYAKLNGPAFTGAPTAPDPDDNTTSRIATISYVLRKMSEVVGIKFEKVASYEALPLVGKAGTIYLVPKGTTTNDIYTEYYYVEAVGGTEGFYEILGDTSVDLTGYYKEGDLVALTEAEVRAAWEAQFPPAT